MDGLGVSRLDHSASCWWVVGEGGKGQHRDLAHGHSRIQCDHVIKQATGSLCIKLLNGRGNACRRHGW